MCGTLATVKGGGYGARGGLRAEKTRGWYAHLPPLLAGKKGLQEMWSSTQHR